MRMAVFFGGFFEKPRMRLKAQTPKQNMRMTRSVKCDATVYFRSALLCSLFF